ncbi:hypothetical protein PpBr36_01597 [Pyricularia pennisetigena]|uniref:hypothetical protein n=1 Tax=Pyricularia pennisetigena TaxID=1578925 RepID=UPI0011538D7D|nr:hypothetical protein PpBr36_01597 [Pyricularia pennisetigena]TLS27882.1 hypothetical protein PpBr36_01597 [Pyricularia pennisetigena]
MANLSEKDLVFSEQANHNFSRILGALKRSNLSIENRLRSIRDDADFVASVHAAYATGPNTRRPLVANERCGSWYVPPESKGGSAYFKSTDGHQGQWNFSTRRLNLHLLPLISEHDGCIIVDSTRRGKRIPDALSKTIPIWCCVLNRVLFPDLAPHAHDVFVPPYAVSDSERAQMLARIPEHVASLKRLDLDLESLRSQVRKPLRPMWVIQPETGATTAGLPGFDDDEDNGGQAAPAATIFEDFHPVICCTSSRRVVGTEMSESGYIQGAGDDTENWAHGLTASVFWAHADRLLSTPEANLADLIRSLVSESAAAGSAQGGGTVAVRDLTGFLAVAALPLPRTTTEQKSGASPVVVQLPPVVTKPETWHKSPTLLEVGIGKGKLASRNLRQALPAICSFVRDAALKQQEQQEQQEQAGEGIKVLIACETGKDVSVGVALALACHCFDEDGNVLPADRAQVDRRPVTKDSIRVRLGRIMTAMPEANPSRATLQSTLGELAPVPHDGACAGDVLQSLLHLGLEGILVRAHVANRLDAGPAGARGAALGVLDGDALFGREAQLLHGVQVDGRVGLAGGRVDAGSGAVDAVAKVLFEADLLQAGVEPAARAARHHGHCVLARLVQRLELLYDALARDESLLELADDDLLLAFDVDLKLVGRQFHAVLLLQRQQHAAKVLADKLLDQRLARERGNVETLDLADLVDEACTALKGELFGQHERVVAVKEESLDRHFFLFLLFWR